MKETIDIMQSVEKIQFAAMQAETLIMIGTVVMLLALACITIGLMWE